MISQEIVEKMLAVEKASTLTSIGIEQFNKSEFDNALELFNRAFELNPKSVPNLLYRSLCRWELLRAEDLLTRTFLNSPKIQEQVKGIESDLIAIIEDLQAHFLN